FIRRRDGAGRVGATVLMNGIYEWQRLYEAAILETDRSRLPRLITEAQAAIDARIEALRSHSDGEIDGETYRIAEEKQAIADALSGIRILKKEVKKDIA
ncbi:MAG: hypothetical protein WA618_19555, partial [Terriglobales bacterium]